MSPFHHHAPGAAVLALLCAALITGCGTISSPTSAARPAVNAASAGSSTAATAFDAVARDLQVADSLTHGPCNPFGLPVHIPAGCPFDAATVSFICTDAHDGLTDVHGYQFLDGTSAPQTAYDSVTTASIEFASHLSGTSTRGPSSTVDDNRALVESGLAGDEAARTWDGVGTSSRQDSVRAPSGSVAVVHRVSSTTVGSVVVPKPWARDSWPLSGTITTRLVADGPVSVDLTSVLSFNGTRYATLAVGDSTFTVDLAAPPRGGPGGPGQGPGGGPPPPGGLPPMPGGGHRGPH